MIPHLHLLWDGGINNSGSRSNNNSSSSQVIKCPTCKASITVEELHEYVNVNPEAKREAIEKERAMWELTYYDMAYYVENIVFCPQCARISHLGNWSLTTTNTD
jgi:hypothetical protein